MNETEKRRAALAAIDVYKAYADTNAQEIANEAVAMMCRFNAYADTYPIVAKFLALRNEADRLRKEVQP